MLLVASAFALNDLPDSIDFVIHTGDVAANPQEATYELAERVFSEIGARVYYAAGNHDVVPLMRKRLTFGPCTFLTDSEERR